MNLGTTHIDLQLDYMRHYIQESWFTLRRGNRQLLRAAIDPKLCSNGQRRTWPVYVSEKEDLSTVAARLKALMPPDDFDQIELRQLPANRALLHEHGLLYLPHDYVVPGGRFNEMYGWDSLWIILGLLHDGEVTLAKSMVDNFVYEIEHYGAILNANRTYSLTRSQPPLLTGMILAVYRELRDRSWLRATLSAIESYYCYWTEGPHYTPETGLSRYYDLGEGPAPEVLADEKDEYGRTHYDRVKEFYRTHPASTYDYGYDLSRFYNAEEDCLTPLFYIADRSMRESGFDPSDRFGRFNVGIIDYNPVCLNSLLFLMERETAEILEILGERKAAMKWIDRAFTRQERINALMWDQQDGFYYDVIVPQADQSAEQGSSTEARCPLRRRYRFGTTFYPLWAGIATEEQARIIVENLWVLEAPGGLQTSDRISGSHWDAPFGWAPLQMIAVKGLRRYGYECEANRIAMNFLSLVLQEFVTHKVIFEKYNVCERTSDTGHNQEFGYKYNVVGFGWTNGTVLELLADLPRLPLSGLGVGGTRKPLARTEEAYP